MRSIKWKRLLAGAGTVLLVVIALVGWSLYRGFSNGQRVDARRLANSQHPLFQSPRPEDGSINYQARIEAIVSQGVNAEANFCVAVLQLSPEDSKLRELLPDDIQQTLSFDSQAAVRFASEQDLNEYAEAIRYGQPEDFENNSDEGRTLRELLDRQQQPLDQLLVELDRRPDYYMPLLRLPKTDESSPATQWLFNAALPHVVMQKQWGDLLAQRSSQRMVAGQPNLAWRDIRGIYQLANRVSHGFSLVESAVALQLQDKASEQLKVLLSQPGADNELLQSVADDLPRVSSVQHWTGTLDLGERASMLEIFDSLSTGEYQLGDLVDQMPPGKLELRVFPWGWVDATAFADQWNETLDQLIVVGRQNRPTEFLKVFAELQEGLAAGPQLRWGLGKCLVGWAPREEATLLAGEILQGMLMPYLTNICADDVGNRVQIKLLQVAIAARRFELENGYLPEHLEQMKDLESQTLENPYTGGRLTWKKVFDSESSLYRVGAALPDSGAMQLLDIQPWSAPSSDQ